MLEILNSVVPVRLSLTVDLSGCAGESGLLDLLAFFLKILPSNTLSSVAFTVLSAVATILVVAEFFASAEMVCKTFDCAFAEIEE